MSALDFAQPAPAGEWPPPLEGVVPVRSLVGGFVYLIGPPGAGKTSLVRELTRGLAWWEENLPFAHTLYMSAHKKGTAADLVELGGRHGTTFAGTDSLSMSVLPKAREWMATRPCELMLAEGDRLACDAFFEAVRDAGYYLMLFHLDAPDEVLAARRLARAAGGKPQNPSWVAGRASKTRLLADRWDAIRLDARDTPADLAAHVRHLCPQLEGLK